MKLKRNSRPAYSNFIDLLKINWLSWAPWHMLIILTVGRWEEEEDQEFKDSLGSFEFEISLGYLRPRL